ncbi:MAG: helix-turn-helix domain-containing protein [archaeon]
MVSVAEKLKEAGLTGNEAKLYYELLRTSPISANELAKKRGMDRTLTYQILRNLTDKGLVNYIIKHNKKFFAAADPNNLLNPIKEKETFVKDLIPELKKIEKIKELIQEVNIYEGKEGLRTIMREVMKDKSLCSFGATGRSYDILYEMPRIAKELMKKGFDARIITHPKYKKHKVTKTKGMKFRYLNIESEVTTSIFGDKVAIHLIKEKPLIILIKNKEIAESYKNHFDFLWKQASVH